MAEPPPSRAAPLQRQAGTLAQALANGRALLEQQPAAALAQARAILEASPSEAAALRLAAAAHRALGEDDLAGRAELAALRASERDPALRAIARALGNKQFGEASRLAAVRLREVPDDLAAMTMSAEAAIALGLADKAEPLLDTVRQRAPAFRPAQMLHISALIQMDRLAEARTAIEGQIAREPDNIAHHRLMYRIASEAGDHRAAARIGARIVELPQAGVEDWVSYGDGLRFAGRKAEAVAAYRRALSIDPAHGRAWWSLADIESGALDEEDIAAMGKALDERKDDPEHAGNLSFALGMAHDRRGNHQAAFAHFSAGNALRRAAQPYDAGELSAQVDRWIALFATAEHLAADAPREGQPVPIFILGMPRSGSTLLERALGMHSQIEAMGELAIMPNLVKRLSREQEAGELERRVAGMSATEIGVLGTRYLERACERQVVQGGKRLPVFVDKLHMNWKHLPVILRALPSARVIDLRRDPLDCCWSNYKTLFARGHPAASDLEDLGRFYRDYVRLADHFRALAPDRVKLVDYGRLVDDFEPTLRGIFDFLGLPFEQACLDFHRSRAPVATASSEQVRQPLNRSGIGRWQPYGEWLGPLRNALGDLAG